ncbi:MAG: hypothetical protein VB934_18735, partial [Polyangiaceae bacterium]
PDGESLALTARLRWRSPEPGELQVLERFCLLEVSTEAPSPPILADAQLVLRHWQAGLVRSATELNRDRDHEGVMRLQQEELPRFMTYAGMHEETGGLAAPVERLLHHCARPMGGRHRKDLFVTSFKDVKGERELRGGKQGPWQDYLFEE